MSPLLSRIRLLIACISALSFTISARAADNDMFANATELGTTSSASLSYRAENATRQVGEPSPSFSNSRTVWWRWTAPSTGELRVKVDTGFSWSGCAIYTGPALESLTQVGSTSSTELVASVTAGTTYHLVIGASSNGAARLEHFPPPPNDNFANRTALGSAASLQIEGRTFFATRESGEPGFDFNSDAGPSVWWSWQAPQDGIVRFDLTGSIENNWSIGIYTGSTLAGLTERLERSSSSGLTLVSTLRVKAGETLAIAAARSGTNSTGRLRLNWTLTPNPYQDTAADALDLDSVTTADGSSNNFGATGDLSASQPGVWWKWTAPISGIASWGATAASGISAQARAYGPDMTYLSFGSSSTGEAGLFPCRAGETYYLLVSMPSSQQATFDYHLAVRPSPANDYMADAAPLVIGENSFETYLSSVEAEEPDTYWDHSVWWEWTAPSAGGLIIDWDPKDYYLLVAYRIEPDGSLTKMIWSSDDMVVQASPSERYLIGVVVWSTQSWKTPVPGGSFKAEFSPTQTGNDAFANAIDLGSTISGRATGDPATATVEPGEPPVYYPSASDRSLWWKWTAPSPGVFGAVGLLPGNQTYTGESALKWYRGTTLATLAGLVTNTVATGDVIYIAVTQQPDGTTRPVTFEYQFIPFATNDALANAIDLGSVTNFNQTTTLAAATVEANEPPHGNSATRSLWWKWTAPADLNIDVRLWNDLDDIPWAEVDVYEPDGAGGLTRLPRRDVYPATAGSIYYFSLASTNSFSGDFRMSSNPPPPGDRYDSPVELGSAASATLKAASTGTREPQDPPYGPNFFNYTQSFWWRWTAPASGLLSLDANYSSHWQILLEDFPGNLVPVTSPVTVSPGQTFRVANFTSMISSLDQSYLKFAAFPPNDLRVNATDLGSAATTSASSLLRAASVESGEDALISDQDYIPSGTVWWTWTAPFSGALRVNALSGAGATSVAVLTGPSAATASLVTSATQRSYSPAETIVAVTAGNRYWIMAGSSYAAQDTLTTLTLEAWPTAPNDHWRSATDLGNAERAEGEGRNDVAIIEPFEPAGQYGSVWWKWTAPRTANATVTADVSATYDEVITVYRDLGGTVPVVVAAGISGSSNSGRMLLFRAQAGGTYYFSVATSSEVDRRTIHVSVDITDPAPNDDFASASTLSGALPLTFTGNATASTRETNEPETSSYAGSLWWNWTAPSSGRVLATITGGSLSVYTGGAIGSLTPVAYDGSPPWYTFQVTGGVTYRLRTNGEGVVSLRLETTTQPANDLFANRQSLGTTNTVSLTTHNFFATAETNEPAHAGTAAARSIWYRWTPASTGRYEIDTSASGLSANLALSLNIAVYRGTSLTALTPVTSGTTRVGFTATAGVEHVFAIDYGRPAPVSIEIHPSSAPPNDNFANRIILAGKTFALGGNSFGSTVETSEPLLVNSPRSLWWEWTAPMTGTVQVSLPYYSGSSSSQPQFRIYSSSSSSPAFSNLSLVGSTPTFFPTAGVRYFFQIAFPQSLPASGVTFRYEGTYSSSSYPRLTVTPPNDRFASWTDIGQVLGVEIAGDVSGATLEPGQSGSSTVGSIGWKWTAPSSGWFAIRRQLNSTPSLIRVLRGSTWATLTTVASGNGEYLWFLATAGETLWIEWQSSSISESSVNSPSRFTSFVIIPEGAAPANDAFASPKALPAGLTGSTTGSTASATAEAGEPMHGGTATTRSLWYDWTATSSGPVSLSATSATMRAGVYTGTSLASLVPVASGEEPLVFNATAGTTYRIALDSATPVSFSLTLREPSAIATNDYFANSILLTGAQGSTPATTRNATIETGEPISSSSSASASTWWHWTAPASGPVTWQSSNSQIEISAYTGDALGDLHYVFASSQKLRFHAVAGTTYRISTAATSTTIDFTLSWQQETTAVANDNFAQATLLPGTPSSVSGTLVGSSYEAGEPRHAGGSNSGIQRSVWYAWTAPASGVFRLTAESAASPTLCVYRNGTLETLDAVMTGIRALDFNATAGVTYHIAVVGPAATNELPFQLKIEAKNYGDNDMFAHRIHLGNASSLTWEGTTEQATQEPGEPRGYYMSTTDGTRWWSWTAPANGAAILRRLEPSSNSSHPYVSVYTGTSLPTLAEINATITNLIAFPVTSGTTYYFQVSDAGTNFVMQLSMAALEHDNFEDPLILPSTLPVTSEIPTNGASTQPGEPYTGRSVWWRWVAPADGWVDVDYRASDYGLSLWVGQGSALTQLAAVPLTSTGGEIRRFFATAGTAYSISGGKSSDSYLGMARITLSAANGTGPANDNFAAALALTGESTMVSTTSRGATTETDERTYLSSTHSRSLWWTWVAPRDGVLTLRASTGWSFLYQGNALASLVPVSPLGGFAGLYPVTAGQSYRIAAGSSAGSDFSLELALSPPGDLFAQPVVLPSLSTLAIPSSITGCSYEAGEPYHGSQPANRSRWFQWTAPSTGPYRIAANGNIGSLRVAVYSGSSLNALTNQGRGTEAAFITATAGQTYRIAVDTASSGGGGDFTLSIVPEPSAYTAWRNLYFGASDPDAGPDGDPDGDGRANLIELALGSDPNSSDPGAPFQFSTAAGPIHLQVRHASELDGWHLGFEVSPTLASWVSDDETPHTRWSEDHGDGTSTLHVILTDYNVTDFPTLLIRLRVEEEEP